MIMQGILQGKPLGRWEFRDAEGYSKNTIARDIQETMGQQYRSGASRIARTETARLQNEASLDRYEKTGIEKVRVHDGCGCSACAAVNGEEWTIDDARSRTTEHPYCKRVFFPIVPGYSKLPEKAPSPMAEDDPGSPYYRRPEKNNQSDRDIVRPGYHQYKLSSDEQTAIDYYQGTGYVPINK